MRPMLEAFAASTQSHVGNAILGVLLGALEDALLVTIVLTLLSCCDFVLVSKQVQTERATTPGFTDQFYLHVVIKHYVATLLCFVVRAAVHFALVILVMAIFAADVLLLRTRGMRFTMDFVFLYFRELDFVDGTEVNEDEGAVAMTMIHVTLAVALAFVGTSMIWLDFSLWNVSDCRFLKFGRQTRTNAEAARVVDCSLLRSLSPHEFKTEQLELELSDQQGELSKSRKRGPHSNALNAKSVIPREGNGETKAASERPISSSSHLTGKRFFWGITKICTFLITATCALLLLTNFIEPLVPALALNDSLNEPLRLVTGIEFQPSLGDGTIESADLYLDSDTEEYTLFQKDVLYRKTTGFKGPKAFDITVDPAKPPNVVVVVVESFRYIDSMYMLGNNPALQAKRHNITLTPHFDRWAKRGLAFRNFWSSWQTSRSLESILFGQLPYDHITDAGTTGGRSEVKLQGMPQLFAQKGYETIFSTGTRLQYDTWDVFLPSHGFETVLGHVEYKQLAEQTKNITTKDWEPVAQGGQGRGLFWGVHDDLTFDILGDLLINKTRARAAAEREGRPGPRPLFLSHYTISSHTPFAQRPAWYDPGFPGTPDFGPLYEGHPRARDIRRYAEMRYFEDLALGEFLDRMHASGVLNETIVVLVGDHGHSPEIGLERPELDQIAVTRVAAAIIAEGRLGPHAGRALDDAAAQYDLLNTLADIVGVPDGGFLQTGIGRSLLRQPDAAARRVIWSNNPLSLLAVVRGRRRFTYDRRFEMMGLYDIDGDPMQTTDLLSSSGRDDDDDPAPRDWRRLRTMGRRLSRYFRVRWDRQCLTRVHC